MTTIAELRTIISQDYLRDPKNKVFTQDTVDRAINKGLTRLEQELYNGLGSLELQATLQTVAGQQEYWMPPNWTRMQLVKWDGTELYKTTLESIQKQNDELTQGSPYCYYIRGNDLWLYSIPDKAWELYIIYTTKSNSIDADNDYVLPEEWIDAITAYAASRLFSSVGKFDFSNEYRTHFEDSMNKLRSQYQFNDENITFGMSRGSQIPWEKVLTYND